MSKTKTFRTESEFRNWLRRNNYTKDAPPNTGIWTKGGSRVGSVFKARNRIEVDIY